MSLIDRFQKAFSVFKDGGNSRTYDPEVYNTYTSYRPFNSSTFVSSDRSVVGAIYNTIAVDVSEINLVHAKVNENGQYQETVKSDLHYCLSTEANIDQTTAAFLQDVANTLFEEGVAAIVAVDTSKDPRRTESYDVRSLRVGRVVNWFARSVEVEVYNDRTGQRETVLLPKRTVAIVVNPLYDVMNKPNSTVQRLIQKLNLLDRFDADSASGRLDMIIQLPYSVKSSKRKEEAERRVNEIQLQMQNSTYGIGYVDATEKITQLNRPIENNLPKSIEYLTNQVYSQLGITPEVQNGSADERTMLNYYSRTVNPIIKAIVESMNRTFLSKTARSQNHKILYFRDPFKLVPISDLSEMADKFTRNEIMTSNEIRGILGMRPSEDDRADLLLNKNLNHPEDTEPIDDFSDEEDNDDYEEE